MNKIRLSLFITMCLGFTSLLMTAMSTWGEISGVPMRQDALGGTIVAFASLMFFATLVFLFFVWEEGVIEGRHFVFVLLSMVFVILTLVEGSTLLSAINSASLTGIVSLSKAYAITGSLVILVTIPLGAVGGLCFKELKNTDKRRKGSSSELEKQNAVLHIKLNALEAKINNQNKKTEE